MNVTYDDVCDCAEILHERALAVLVQRLAERPADGGLRWRLAEMLRCTGDLSGALREYRRLAEEGPRREAAGYVAGLLAGDASGAGQYDEAAAPAPFVLLDEALDEAQRSSLWGVVEEQRNAFTSSRVFRYDNAYGVVSADRVSRGLHRGELRGIRDWYTERLGRLIEPCLATLGIAPFVPARWELHLLSYGDGDHFSIHTDTLAREGGTRRAVTAVYYFHRTPRRFTGGDVLLFDTDRRAGQMETRFTRLTPEDNSLLIFPSDCYHQVTPVHGPANLEESRFALVAWMHRG
ncbi:2OG-Fe(II) oxygenase [Endothiovibrio diazotrophicus]